MPGPLVAVLLPCYGFAAVGKSIALASDDSGHALAHWAEHAHHHHDDGSAHDDDSIEASLHMQAVDASSSPVLMPVTALVPVPRVFAELRAMSGLSATSPPFLEGLRRPPRSELDPC